MPADKIREHTYQVCDDEAALVDCVRSFVLRVEPSDALVVIATPSHRAAIEHLLEGAGTLAALTQSGGLVMIDASDALGHFMRRGMPDRTLFLDMVGKVVSDAQLRFVRVFAFGEMVSLLWDRGQSQAALALEDLWNELIGHSPLALMCAYTAQNMLAQDVRDIAERHTGLTGESKAS